MKVKKRLGKMLGAFSTLLLMPGVVLSTTVPEQTREFAMTPHEHFDVVLHEVFVDLAIIGVLFSIVTIYFLVAYRRKSADDVGKMPKLSTQAKLGWLIIPSALFMADDIFLFANAWDLHDNYRKVPADAYEIKVTGSLWSWTYEYPNGVQSSNELIVPVNKPVLLRMTSTDVVHSHYLNKYRVTEDVMPGRVTYQWFMPDEVGESVVTCREYCGMLHSGMYGKVKVLEQVAFDGWLQQQAANQLAPEEKSIVKSKAEDIQAQAVTVDGGRG